jgi:hypothetical protein
MTGRLRWLLAVVAVGVVVVVVWRRSTPRPERERPPVWPAFDPPPDQRAAPAATWVAPVDGACPGSHPVKVNTRSGIFHVPGGRSYDRTTPDRCYSTPEEADRDGYRRAKA